MGASVGEWVGVLIAIVSSALAATARARGAQPAARRQSRCPSAGWQVSEGRRQRPGSASLQRPFHRAPSRRSQSERRSTRPRACPHCVLKSSPYHRLYADRAQEDADIANPPVNRGTLSPLCSACKAGAAHAGAIAEATASTLARAHCADYFACHRGRDNIHRVYFVKDSSTTGRTCAIHKRYESDDQMRERMPRLRFEGI